ncbi:MAG: DUF1002 domain-containing protein [Lachnospiraceae bacterium]|nr:DUF1002 domain-containing protein [Lachnospiraceae bacterium]
MKKRGIAVLMTAVVAVTTLFAPMTVMADRVDNKPYISLGADLTADQKSSVLNLLGVKESELENYTVATITNADEHKYLDSYLDKSVIGSKALSSVTVTGKDSGHGIQVTTHNISYCTVGMYQNALATAGIENADVVVAGPFSISGTAALVGAIQSYATMNGKTISPELVDGATNELVVTSKVADNIGDSDKAEQLIAAVKQVVVANEYKDEEDINKAIDEVAVKLEISLSEEDRALIRELMSKLSGLDINVDSLKEQAKDIYDSVKNMDLSEFGISQEDADNFFSSFSFSDIWDSIVSFFQGLFN